MAQKKDPPLGKVSMRKMKNVMRMNIKLPEVEIQIPHDIMAMESPMSLTRVVMDRIALDLRDEIKPQIAKKLAAMKY